MNSRLYIYDCLTAKLRVSDRDFMTIGRAEGNTFRVTMRAANGGVFAQRNGFCRFFPKTQIGANSLNGCELNQNLLIRQNTHYMLVLADGCFVLWYGDEDKKPDFAAFMPQTWYTYSQLTGEWSQGMKLTELCNISPEDSANMMATFDGLGSYVFLMQDILKVAAFAQEIGIDGTLADNSTDKLLSCPSCRSPFTQSELLSIATHPEQKGDEVLGAEAMRRFKATTIDSEGFVTDEAGARCTEIACPVCHHKLPPFFEQMKQHIFSLIGVPASGKSYFLAALVQELEHTLPMVFGIPFRDADPSSNQPLREMRARVFSADNPQEAHLSKINLRMNSTRRVQKNGACYEMPRPFIYTLNKGQDIHSVVLYINTGSDNDGNLKETNSADSDNLKLADSIFFLFDPTSNPGFRTLLKGGNDPQIKQSLYPPGRQSRLLAETEIRLRTELNLPPGRKINKPLALLIGKCDTWLHLLGPEPLLPAVRNNQVRMDNIDANSERLRELLFRIAPQICANVEAISSNVRYFAVSSFGKSAIEFTDKQTGDTLLGPPGAPLTPIRVADAFIWSICNLAPNLLQSYNS
ncbi:MAG: hypothetical protein IJ503_03925 [Akkermansia sp.]|nr:hypothetical protein [Akkermansia sp.]